MTDFESFPKIPRWSRSIVVTEKIDGTNAQIYISSDPNEPIRAGSRNRWITPEDDNYGFASWVNHNGSYLRRLGPGRHFGEWWGSGIQRGYGLTKGEKRFSLFNVGRWTKALGTPPLSLADKQQLAPACCHIVPTLYAGPMDQAVINGRLAVLNVNGSAAAPGFMKPEGIIIYHTAANVYYKKTLEKDDAGKWEK